MLPTQAAAANLFYSFMLFNYCINESVNLYFFSHLVKLVIKYIVKQT